MRKIITDDKGVPVGSVQWKHLLELKLMEGVMEFYQSGNMAELDDLERVINALRGKDNSFSKGYVLTNEWKRETDYAPVSHR